MSESTLLEEDQELIHKYNKWKNYFVTVQKWGGEVSEDFTLEEIIRLSHIIKKDNE